MVLIRNFNIFIVITVIIFFIEVCRKAITPIGLYGLWDWLGVVKFASDFIFLMSKETYQEIKRISGEELKELLSNLDNVFDLGTGTLMGNNCMTSANY